MGKHIQMSVDTVFPGDPISPYQKGPVGVRSLIHRPLLFSLRFGPRVPRTPGSCVVLVHSYIQI